MLNAITTKLEIDVMQVNELDPVVQLAVIHNLPAIVVHQQLATQALMTKVRRRGQFKIIVAIDWPKGESFGMVKLRGITKDMMESDGFEILSTGGKNEIETRNEAKILVDFIKTQISPTREVRFVLGCHTRPEDEALLIAKIMKDIRSPTLLRTDHHLRMQVTKANVKTHTALMKSIRSVCGLPIKLSGNIDSIRTIAGCLQIPNGPSRFAVNLQQMQQIVRDLQKQPNELHELLGASK